MGRKEPDVRLLCCASIIALFLGGCSHTGNKQKSGIANNEGRSTSVEGGDKSHTLQSIANGSQWLQRKSPSLASGSSQYDNLWDRLFDLYDLPPIEHQDIERELAWFINHPSYIERVQERAEPFLFSIVKQIEKHDIPGEIALLPAIESAFQPHAVSPANAAGIWQFIPSTGRLYGLKRSHTYDGRRDVYASTKAAIKYLKKLHKQFDGDWLLAIAGYNCGEGAVERAIEKNMARNLPTDFWSLDLPQETRSYVPRLLAIAKLFVGADQYGIRLNDIPNVARFKPVKVNKQLDLALAADAANMPLEKLYALNPGFRGKFADIEGGYHLFIPAEKKAADFRRELERLAMENQTAWQPATVVNDTGNRVIEPETISIPVRRSVKTGHSSRSSDAKGSHAVMAVNENKKQASQRSEKKEAIKKESHKRSASPEESQDRKGRVASAQNATTPVRGNKKINYSVLPGETLWAVARKHAVDVGQLSKWNGIPETTKVQAGQRLVVWSKDAAKKLPPVSVGIRPSQSSKYTVRAGDTLFSISRRFKVSVADLRKSNGWKSNQPIQAGKSITVPK